MAESTQVKKGWLYTRENKQFAPYTLVENVYTRSGKKYDERVREYINSLTSYVKTAVAAITGDIDNIKKKNSDQDVNISSLQTKVKNFDGEDSSQLFIIDNFDNVIAYIDATGIHSTDFITKNNVKLSDLPSNITVLSGQIDSLEEKTQDIEEKTQDIEGKIKNIDGTDNDKFFIVDNENNVIAYFDEDGMHVTNVLVGATVRDGQKPQDVYNLYEQLRKIDINDAALQEQITSITNVFNPSDKKCYFIDDNNNVIAYIDEQGIHSVNFIIGETYDSNGNILIEQCDLYSKLQELSKAIGDEVTNRKKAINEAIQGLDGTFVALRESDTTIFNILGESSYIEGTTTSHKKRLDDVETKVGTLEGKVENVSNVMDFVGSYETIADRDSKIPNPNKGDVCIVKDVENKGFNKEYVYNNGWEELGDVSAESQRISELEGKYVALSGIVGNPSAPEEGTHEDRLDDLEKATENFKDDESEKLFIIDANENVIAYFDINGLTTINTIIKNNEKEKNLLTNGIYIDIDKITDITIEFNI